jgi:hypothetical protein
MDGKQLQPWQAAKLRDTVRHRLHFMNRLQRRMEKVGFLPDDPLLKLVRQAQASLHALFIEMHYRSCEGGVGRPRNKDVDGGASSR